MIDKQVAMITSLWITAENIGSFLGAVGGGAAYDRFAGYHTCELFVLI